MRGEGGKGTIKASNLIEGKPGSMKGRKPKIDQGTPSEDYGHGSKTTSKKENKVGEFKREGCITHKKETGGKTKGSLKKIGNTGHRGHEKREELH